MYGITRSKHMINFKTRLLKEQFNIQIHELIKLHSMTFKMVSDVRWILVGVKTSINELIQRMMHEYW